LPENKFQIDSLQKILQFEGSPHKKLPVIAVAGTNGKGSVSEYISRIMISSGKKTGLYTSPHIFNFTERIRINSEAASLRMIKEELKKIKVALRETGVELSQFEKLTAAAILLFFREKCDVAVMETGLGGRLDATNVCENKIASVITPISVEHTEYLGESIESIAAEKAGIIKEEGLLIDFSRTAHVRETGKKMGCRVFSSGIECKKENIESQGDGFYSFDFKAGNNRIKNIKPGMRGLHQCDNAAAAATLGVAMKINQGNIKEGCRQGFSRGRLEVFDAGDGKKLIVDAAHNPSSAETLAEYLRERPDSVDVFLIMGVLKDKDYEAMASFLMPEVKNAFLITPASERALDCSRLAGCFGSKGETAESFAGAFRNISGKMKRGDWLVCCGSFSVVRPALEYAYREYN